MPDPEVRFRESTTALKEQDFRLTPQRVELLRLIAISEGHPSASQLYARMKERFPTMSPATGYKTLALLKEMDQVLEIDLRGVSRYDGHRPDSHPHLICMQCSRIVDGDLSLDHATIRKLEKDPGFRIARSQLTFHGRCRDCRRRSD